MWRAHTSIFWLARTHLHPLQASFWGKGVSLTGVQENVLKYIFNLLQKVVDEQKQSQQVKIITFSENENPKNIWNQPGATIPLMRKFTKWNKKQDTSFTPFFLPLFAIVIGHKCKFCHHGDPELSGGHEMRKQTARSPNLTAVRSSGKRSGGISRLVPTVSFSHQTLFTSRIHQEFEWNYLMGQCSVCSDLLPRTNPNSFWNDFLPACPKGSAYLGRSTCC